MARLEIPMVDSLTNETADELPIWDEVCPQPAIGHRAVERRCQKAAGTATPRQ